MVGHELLSTNQRPRPQFALFSAAQKNSARCTQDFASIRRKNLRFCVVKKTYTAIFE
jgi:hypothetical protein